MFCKANYETVVTSKQLKTEKLIGGSSCIRTNEDIGIIKIKNVENVISKNKGKVKCIVIKDFNDYYVGQVIYLINTDYKELLELGHVEKIVFKYKLNKTKVRGKIIAYANLKKSKKFMAFYSISFPKGLSDEIIRTIHNTALTRIRKYRKSFSYIWVAERQRNGTLHFHMLTNEYLNIRIINHIYKKAISNAIDKNKLTEINYDQTKYNGVDVKLVESILKLTKYLTKYLTKNNSEFDGLCWNCDSSISALVTTLYLNDDEFKSIYSKLALWKVFDKNTPYLKEPLEFFIYTYGSHRPKLIFETLQEINEHIISNWYKKQA